MKVKKICSLLVAILISGAMSASTIAATPDKTTGKTEDSLITARQENRGKTKLSDEQKAEMKARMEAIAAKWSVLTDEQKKEIYALKDKQAELENQVIDKYLKYGVIDKTTAEKMKACVTESKTKMRESGKIPMFGNKGFNNKKPVSAKDSNDKSTQ